MAKTADLRVEFDDDDWRRGDIWRPDGVLSCWVTLKLRGATVVDYRLVGANNSAVTLTRSLYQSHTGATAATADAAAWPMFFCAGDLPNRCGVILDFSVDHVGNSVVMHSFHRCELDSSARITIPTRAWFAAVMPFARSVARRLPTNKAGVKARRQPTYRRYRRLLLKELQAARSVAPGV
jgi:hypothetical protein